MMKKKNLIILMTKINTKPMKVIEWKYKIHVLFFLFYILLRDIWLQHVIVKRVFHLFMYM